jgi:putative phosphoribosyl transferase
MEPRPFHDRIEAGRLLAGKLTAYANRTDVIVLGLPRGGVPVAYEVARALNAPLDVFLVRKLGVPGHEEFAMGAIATGGVRVLNDQTVRALRISGHVIEAVAAKEQLELDRRARLYRGVRPVPDLHDKDRHTCGRWSGDRSYYACRSQGPATAGRTHRCSGADRIT